MTIPCYIISYNRLDPLQKLLDRIQNLDLEILIIDNASTWEPLLDFYSTCDFRIAQMPDNLGHAAPWTSDLIRPGTPFIVTDPDVVPIEDCPEDIIEFMCEVKQKHYEYVKVGLSLMLDDLPDCYNQKEKILKWENQFWGWTGYSYKGVKLYQAPVDTTFAIYDPGTKQTLAPAARIDYPYMARHLPWYADSNHPTDEDIFYKNSAIRQVISWSYDELLNRSIQQSLQRME